MKKIILLKKALAVAFAMFTCHSALAYDFYKDGIYYNIISKDDRTVEVARSEGGLFGNYSEAEYTIPSKVIYAKTTYTVIAIEEYAFSDCSSLASIDIPSSVTTIGEYAFSDCSRLESINIPSSLTTIGKRAFEYCSRLASIDIPSSVTAIGEQAFINCSSLNEINVDKNNQSYASVDGVLYTKDMNALNCFPIGKVITNFKIPDGVTSIAMSAFEGCSSLASINIPGSVATIGDRAFYGCSSLASIDIPSSVTTIGEHAFSNCIRLTSVDMTGSSVTTIGDGAFSVCSRLTSVDMTGSSVTTIGDGAFYACSSLTSIDLPGSLTTIWKRAFAYCSSLALIDLPSSLTTIDEEAFYGCSSLVSVYCRATTPPSAEYDIFPDETLQGTLYVPIGTKADYEAVDPWRNFWTIEETDFSTGVNNALRDDGITVVANGNSIVVIGDNAGRIEVYCVNGQCVYSGTDTVIDNLAKGVYVVKVDNKTFKVLL